MSRFRLGRVVRYETTVEADTLKEALNMVNGEDPDSIPVWPEEELVDSTDWELVGEEDRT